MRRCPTCGSDVPDGFAFCGGCGGKLPSDEAVPGPPVDQVPGPAAPEADAAAQEQSWARSHPGVTAALTAVLLVAAGTATLFTVGYPMGWPLGARFNMLFVVMGGIFVAVGVHALLKPGSVRVGGTTRFGHMVGGRTATRREGQAFGLLFILGGVGFVVFADLMGLLIGGAMPPPIP
ncbi:MAG: hypothetical protein JXB32_10305 [Deltaproteobacteria bacterium]|nr:hypothetical protein [Deltaproteobacteria bacterium]